MNPKISNSHIKIITTNTRIEEIKMVISIDKTSRQTIIDQMAMEEVVTSKTKNNTITSRIKTKNKTTIRISLIASSIITMCNSSSSNSKISIRISNSSKFINHFRSNHRLWSILISRKITLRHTILRIKTLHLVI